MATVIDDNIITATLKLPAITWLTIIRKNFGSRFLGQSYINAVLLPFAVVFSTFPFTGRLVWEESLPTLIYSVIGALRASYEYLATKIGSNRGNIHSDSTGQPRDFWLRLKLFKHPNSIRRYGEPLLAFVIGALFYYTEWDKFFGGIMIYTGLACAVMQLQFDRAYEDEVARFRNAMLEERNAEKEHKQAEGQINDLNVRNAEKFFDVD